MDENAYYSRQMALREIGIKGQEKLKKTKVLIVGAGGLGHPSSMYLAAAGIGEIGIMDFDHVEFTNLNRQIGFGVDDIGQNKAAVLAGKIRRQSPYIKVVSIEERLVAENILNVIDSFDLVLDCSDNLSTKFLLHDFSWFLEKDLIQASIYQYEGQIQCFNYAKSKQLGCLRCLWPKSPENECVQDCQGAGVIGATAGILGTCQAFEALKLILGIGEVQTNKTIIINLLNLEIQKISWKKEDSCYLCSSLTTKEELYERHRSRCSAYEKIGLDHTDFVLVDIREKHELSPKNSLQNYRLVSLPLSEFTDWKSLIKPDHKYLFICEKGIRSKRFVQKLRREDINNCFSLFGGLNSVSN